jgi:hypothetical protein
VQVGRAPYEEEIYLTDLPQVCLGDPTDSHPGVRVGLPDALGDGLGDVPGIAEDALKDDSNLHDGSSPSQVSLSVDLD